MDRSLAIELHDIVVWDSADWALSATSRTFYASCDVTAGNKSGITLVFVAELAHLGYLPTSRCSANWLGLGSTTDFSLIRRADCGCHMLLSVVMLVVIMGFFDLLIVFHENQLSIGINCGLINSIHELHLFT